jgi:serine protease Do
MTPPGTDVTLNIIRDGKPQDLSVELGELPTQKTAMAPEAETSEKLGFTVQNLTAGVAEQLGYETTEGVVVSRVDPNSAAFQAGMRRGMLIRQVNRQTVHDTEDFHKALTQSEAESKPILLLVQDQETTRYIALRLTS